LYHAKEKNQLFFNLLFTYLHEIVAAIVVTLVYASLNLLVPELIRQFMHFMREKHLERREYGDFIEKFIIIQLLRIFFSEHSKRLFHELAIKVESTLARKLVSKSLRMAKECRDRIPESEIIQLENVDLRLIFTLFRNMNIIFEAPFTIVVSIILLFN
jgi:ABC-type multidrug transport system fused ATPase/permease subunit